MTAVALSLPARFDLKMDSAEKALLARAASLLGTTMASFVRSAAKEKAQRLIDDESRIRLTAGEFEAFASALNGGFQPNAALADALAAAQAVRSA